MKRFCSLISTALLVASSTALAEPAHGDAESAHRAAHATFSPIQLNADGTVEVDGVQYPDMRSYHTSAAFRDEGRRCGAIEPSFSAFAPSDCSFSFTRILPEYEPGDVFEIPVVFHVIEHSSGAGRISEELLLSQMEILNEDFLAIEGTPGAPGTDGAIRFVLATVDPDGNPTTGIERIVNNAYFNDSFSTKPDLVWNPDIYLNIYTNTASGALGYATFPAQSAGEADDGVVLLHTSVGRNAPQGGQYNQGRTATHEVGHYFGLFHTFQDGCSTGGGPYASGDRIADTQSERDPAFGCPTGSSSGCPGGGLAPIENYMDYSDDICMNRFTAEQVNRMRCSIVNYRASLLNAWPEADFDAATEDGLSFSFTDDSSDPNDTIASYRWVFGDGATSSERNPSHTFTEFGVYDVELTVTDGFGAKRRVVKEIVADPPPVAAFSFDRDGLAIQFLDQSTDPNGQVVEWEWSFGDGGTSTDRDPLHVYEAIGVYQVQLSVTDEAGATATFTGEITVEEGGCGCVVAGSPGGDLPWHAGLVFGLALIAIRRRRRA